MAMSDNALAEKPKILHFSDALPSKTQFGERVRLHIVDGPNLGHGYCLMGDIIIIGREENCDLPLTIDDKVSRRHVVE